MNAARRNLALDVLRAFAILLVLGRHMTPECPGHFPAWAKAFFDGWQRCGWFGVDLFFVLSGFLVSGLLFREHQRAGRVDFGRFFARRGFKIYPAFYVLLVVYGLAEHKLTGAVTWQKALCEATFMQPYLGFIWRYTWSLGVEEHFYVCAGILIAVLSRAGALRRLVPVWAATAAGCLAARIVVYDWGRHDEVIYATHMRMDSLFFGVILSYAYHLHRPRLDAFVSRAGAWLVVVAIPLLAIPTVLEIATSRFVHTYGLTLTYVAFGALMLFAVHRSESMARFRPFRWLAWMGEHSYAIYLWHEPIKRGFTYLRKVRGIDLGYLGELAAYVTLSVLVGFAATRIIEIPALRLRDRWFPSRSGALQG